MTGSYSMPLALAVICFAATACSRGPAPQRGDADAGSSTLPYTAMAATIVAALQPSAGERVILRHDPRAMPELERALRSHLERAGALVETLGFDSVPGFDARLANTEIYVWLPTGGAGPTPEQRTSLIRWLDSGRGRQIHFHWGDGTIGTNQTPAAHTPLYDSMYVAALDIDYKDLNRRMDSAISLLRSGEVRVTTPEGTDLRFRIGERPVSKQNGDASKDRMGSARVRIDREIELPAGAIRVAPLEETVHGTLVVPLLRLGSTDVRDIRLEFDTGRVVKATAASNESLLRSNLLSVEALTHFREFALGLNPRLRIPAGRSELPYYGYGAGAVRLSLGDNTELGGRVRGDYVQWLFFTNATVTVGDSALVKDGRLKP